MIGGCGTRQYAPDARLNIFDRHPGRARNIRRTHPAAGWRNQTL